MPSEHERSLIIQFVTLLTKHGLGSGKVDRWPDEENRQTQDIDAISGDVAIEHTSIDTPPYQRRNDEWYIEFLGDLRDFIPCPGYLIEITLPPTVVGQNVDMEHNRNALRTWITDVLPGLPDTDNLYHAADVDGLPYQIQYSKLPSSNPGLYFLRGIFHDGNLDDRIRKSVTRKSAKLRPYGADHTTILLLEFNNYALINEHKARRAVQNGLRGRLPDGVNRIWYADTSILDNVLFTDFTDSLGT